jgi:hypothetical protein
VGNHRAFLFLTTDYAFGPLFKPKRAAPGDDAKRQFRGFWAKNRDLEWGMKNFIKYNEKVLDKYISLYYIIRYGVGYILKESTK